MIYLKIGKNNYNSLNLEKIQKDYPTGIKKYLALHRIISKCLNNELKNYPDIDIVISDKKQSRNLGKFFINLKNEHKEYNFIPQKSGNPYIVLFSYSILNYFKNHSVKGIKEVFLHEFFHFRQWLLNEKLNHSQGVKAIDNPLNVDQNIKIIAEILNRGAK